MKWIAVFLLVTSNLIAQQSLLQSGPMVGYSEMKEVQLWLQTKEAAKVKMVYWEKGKADKRHSTLEYKTLTEKSFCVKLLADEVLPGRKYQYEVYVNNRLLKFDYPLEFQTLTLYQHRFSPPDFTFATGSCAYVNDTADDRWGKPFGGGYEIYTSIFQKKPDFMLWLGDNTYLREPDWNSRTGIFYRYTHTRSLPELQPLLASCHHYATWDDHDYGPNDGDRSFPFKVLAEEAFNTFWCNPNTNLTGKGGITSTFIWNDCQFFLMDDRWFKSPNVRMNTDRSYLGKEQIEWLMDALSFSKATFKFVCIGTQVLNPVQTKENYSTYPEELQTLLNSIEQERITGVIFLTGDRHFTELTKLPRNKSYPLYDLTVSPLLSRLAESDEGNYLRVEGTVVREKNFAILQVQGGPENRKLVINVCNAKGDLLWKREIAAKELR